MDIIEMIRNYGSECRWEGHYFALGDRKAEEATKKEIEYQLTKIKHVLASQQDVEADKNYCTICKAIHKQGENPDCIFLI